MKAEKSRPDLDVQDSAPTQDEPAVAARVDKASGAITSPEDVVIGECAGEILDTQPNATQLSDGVTTIIDTSAAAVMPARRNILARGLPPVQIDDRLGRLVLSIILAVLLWFYVANLENPAQTTSFKGRDVEVRGTRQDLRVISMVPTVVDMTVQAPQDLMSNLRQSDLHPYIDLKGLDAGVHEVPVLIDAKGLQNGSVNTSVDPGRVQVQLEIQATKVLSVVVQLNGTPAMGYRTDVPQVEPGSVRITGSQDAVNRIKQVIVPVDIDAKASTQQGQRSPVAIDDSGKEVNRVAFDPSTVQVSVPIKLLFNYKAVPVRVPIIGQPAPGLAPIVKWQPTNVTVCCSPNILEALQSLETAPVGITGTTSTVVTTTELILPPNVELYPGQSRTISVTVEMEVLQSTLDIPVAPSAEGVPPGYAATVQPDRISVTLAGTFNRLQSIKPSDVKAFVDASGHDAGTFDLPLQTTAPQGVRIQHVSQDKVTVTLVAPTPVPPTPTLTQAPTPSAAPTFQPTATVPELAPPTASHTPTHAATATATATPTTQQPTRSPTALPTTPATIAPATLAPPSPTLTLAPPPTASASPTATPVAASPTTISTPAPTPTQRLAIEANP